MAELFNLKVGNFRFKNPLALSAMAGITDSKFARVIARDVGLVVLGGFSVDAATQKASKEMIRRGRQEFIFGNAIAFLKSELKAFKNENVAVALNVRAASVAPLVKVAELAKKYRAILELNAHCRQPEILALGAGDALLSDLPRLSSWIKELKKTGVVLSIKVRGNIVDDVALARIIEEAGADIIHVDALGAEGSDPSVIKKIRNATDLFIIGNNSVNDFESAHKLFSRGADMVSIARAAKYDPTIFKRLALEIEEEQKKSGWYNAPKHICRDGDLRALAFCCQPVKNCPLHDALKLADLGKEEYARIKVEFARNTLLEKGDTTCYGSLVWCCTVHKPCIGREAALRKAHLSDAKYMQLKKELAEHIKEYTRQKRCSSQAT